MTRMHNTLTAIAATLLLSGTAFAAGSQPAAGEGPFFQTEMFSTHSQVQRAEVRAAAALQAPLAGNLPVADVDVAASSLSRAEVRADAIAHQPASGIAPLFTEESTVSSVKLPVAASVAAVSLQPAMGNLPFAMDHAGSSTADRADVRAAALESAPAAGAFSAQADVQEASLLSRAQVREQTRNALLNGYHVQSGNFS